MRKHQAANTAKRKNIVDMAITHTAMIRLFSKGSKDRIARELDTLPSSLSAISSFEDFEDMHRAFCVWFCRNIYTAEKKIKNKKIKLGQAASFGQAAKVLDIVLKVYVFYCSQPSSEVASRINPFLHGAIDNPIMNYLKAQFPDVPIGAATIEQINEQTYRSLQSLIARDIRDTFQGNLFPVQYDDVKWRELNRR
jgi:hypothetical protein